MLPHNENDHNISGLLKLFIRDLPQPLLSWDHYDAWVRSIIYLFYSKLVSNVSQLTESLYVIRIADQYWTTCRERTFLIRRVKAIDH